MAFEQAVKVLHDGKAALRRTRQNAPLEEKILDLWRAQHIYVQIVGMRRQLMPWERPWNIMSDVRAAIVIRDGNIQTVESMPSLSVSSPHWVRPRRPWVLSV